MYNSPCLNCTLISPVQLSQPSLAQSAAPIEIELFAALEKQAHQRGVQVETLANLWLQQKLVEQRQLEAA